MNGTCFTGRLSSSWQKIKRIRTELAFIKPSQNKRKTCRCFLSQIILVKRNTQPKTWIDSCYRVVQTIKTYVSRKADVRCQNPCKTPWRYESCAGASDAFGGPPDRQGDTEVFDIVSIRTLYWFLPNVFPRESTAMTGS